MLKGYRSTTPLGNGEGRLSGIEAVSLGRGEQEHRVACNGEGGNELDGKLGANLGLADTNKLFFVAMVDLDIPAPEVVLNDGLKRQRDRKSTRLNSSHANISYAVFCLKKKKRYKRKDI